jgi:hypothetical protein
MTEAITSCIQEIQDKVWKIIENNYYLIEDTDISKKNDEVSVQFKINEAQNKPYYEIYVGIYDSFNCNYNSVCVNKKTKFVKADSILKGLKEYSKLLDDAKELKFFETFYG